ncbi:L,D-transpeptidase family protein [Bradyrhizobium sp. 2TAF24]|uniref:L,D-transpeptidase family protein n=1 Tax=Bradyrhizobium sp. 2TAF24 TaxID=3233011 RepID=UPI003F8ED3EA
MKRALFILVVAATDVLGASLIHGQSAVPQDKAAPQSAAAPQVKITRDLPATSDPTFDQGTAGRIKEAIQRYAAIAAHGGWPILAKDAKFTPGVEGPHDALLRRRLIATGDLAADKTSGAFDDTLTTAVKHFQTRHGLPETGTVGPRTLAALDVPVEQRSKQLEASLLRTSAINFGFGPRFVAVNIPAAYVEAVEGDKVVHRYRVVVGKTEKPSPTVSAEITDISLNPRWTVPASITKNEIAAHMRSDPGYLARMHMQLYDEHDGIVDPATVDWSEGRTPNVIVRQDPGSWNALGQLKINMPNAYAVYMHDTNQKSLLSRDYRFDSHGCVRVDQVRDLAAWLLQDTPGWDRAGIDAAIATNERQNVQLAKKVPVAWIYLTAWMTRDGTVHFRDDIYEQDTQLLDAAAEERSFFEQAQGAPGKS